MNIKELERRYLELIKENEILKENETQRNLIDIQIIQESKRLPDKKIFLSNQYQNKMLKKENTALKSEIYDLKKRNNELFEELIKLKSNKRKYHKRSEEVRIKEKEYKEFRKIILERDNYTCQQCGCKEKLQVHHIKSRKDYPELIMDKDNCITLCIVCHAKTDNYFGL